MEEQGLIQNLEKIGFSSFYIDWKAIAHDWFIDSYYSVYESHNKIHVFSRY